MKKLLLAITLMSLVSGCSVVAIAKKYWPRDHDPVMFSKLVTVHVDISSVDCEKPDWSRSMATSNELFLYSEWRSDPQKENLKGLHDHVIRMNKGGSKTFCELGKKTALQRIDAAKTAWEGR